MPILNYSTTIAADKSVADICKLLSAKGANKIITDYENGKVVSIQFAIAVKNTPIHFKLPCNWKQVQKALIKQKVAKKYQSDEHAIKVTWRILKDWIEAQVALIEAEQAAMEEVFIPYAIMANKKTVSQNLLGEERSKFLLTT